jgi:hypothetical protein
MDKWEGINQWQVEQLCMEHHITVGVSAAMWELPLNKNSYGFQRWELLKSLTTAFHSNPSEWGTQNNQHEGTIFNLTLQDRLSCSNCCEITVHKICVGGLYHHPNKGVYTLQSENITLGQTNKNVNDL